MLESSSATGSRSRAPLGPPVSLHSPEDDESKDQIPLPWFIVGFLAMIALRNLNLIPQAALSPMAAASGLLTVAAMAALGLQTYIRAVARAGGRVVAAVVLSLAALVGLSLGLIAVLGV